MSYPDNATASLAQFLFRDSQGAMYIIPRRAFHNGSQYGDAVTLVQDLSGNGNDLTGTAVFDRRSFFGGNMPLDNVRDAQFIRDVNMSAPVSGVGTTIRAVPGGTLTFDEGVLNGTITGEFSVLILIDRTLSEREKHVVSELTRLWGGANWTPGVLFMAGKDGFWLDPSDHSTLWIDEARTQNATQPGDVVWWVDDKSGNENHFSVESSADRARLVRWPASAVREGGVRNLLRNSDDITTVLATGTTSRDGLPAVSAPSVIPPAGSFSVQRVTPSAGTSLKRIRVSQSADGYWFCAVRLKYDGIRYFCIGLNNTLIDNNAVFDILDKVFIAPNGNVRGDTGITDLGDGWVEIYSTMATSTPAQNVFFYVVDSFEKQAISYEATCDGAAGFYYAGMTVQAETTPLPYQRVGAGIWDVTEEGQPDCWGILGNGVNTRYTSERGIPEYEDGKLRMLVGQTKFDAPGASMTLNISGNFRNDGSVNLYNDQSAQILRVRDGSRTLTNTVSTGGVSTAIADMGVETDGDIRTRIQVNSLPESHESFDSHVDINTGKIDILNGGVDSSHFNGILWSTILTAYGPDETLWNRVARDWLNSTNMPGVLDDD